MRQKTERHQYAAERTIKDIRRALSEQNSKYLARPSNRSDRPEKMQENQWPRNPVLTFWQSKRICSDNAALRHTDAALSSVSSFTPQG
jgi:hypothetical protein